MTPAERVQRLREETAKATDGPWSQSEEIDGIRAGRFTTVRAAGESSKPVASKRVVTVDQTRPHHEPAEPNVAHIARWDPKAAEKVLDLLDVIFAYHWLIDAGNRCAQGDPWPCGEYAVASAVLDALDPPERT